MSRGDHDHVIYASTLPVMLGPALHMAEAWNEAVCNGAWGSTVARLGERIREAVDLEHWSAFRESFISLEESDARRWRRAATARGLRRSSCSAATCTTRTSRGGTFEGSDDHAPVWQAVCSPMRNPLSKRERRVIRLGMSRRLAVLARALARAAGVKPTRLGWKIVSPGRSSTTRSRRSTSTGGTAKIRIEKVDERGLHETYSQALAPERFDTMRD